MGRSRGRGFRAVVEIETMVVRAGSIGTAREAMAWAADNRDMLIATWRRLNKLG